MMFVLTPTKMCVFRAYWHGPENIQLSLFLFNFFARAGCYIRPVLRMMGVG